MLNQSLSEQKKGENISSLIHSGRTSLSVVLGFLDDLHAGRGLTEQDTIDAISSGRKIREIFESLARSNKE